LPVKKYFSRIKGNKKKKEVGG
jgi:hypothetical protein